MSQSTSFSISLLSEFQQSLSSSEINYLTSTYYSTYESQFLTIFQYLKSQTSTKSTLQLFLQTQNIIESFLSQFESNYSETIQYQYLHLCFSSFINTYSSISEFTKQYIQNQYPTLESSILNSINFELYFKQNLSNQFIFINNHIFKHIKTH